MMSPTFPCFQAPVHTYGHPETEPQQPHFSHQFSSSYSTDSRSLADYANSYAQTENLYDPGYGYITYGLENFNTQIGVVTDPLEYDPMMHNNSYASPQLLCLRPTLPPSPLPSHFSWYTGNWLSEASADVCQADGNRLFSESFIPHVPQAGVIQHSSSSGNQQFMSKIYPAEQEFADSVCIPLASTYLADGCTRPFAAPIPSFDQSPTKSTHFNIQPYTAVSQGLLKHYTSDPSTLQHQLEPVSPGEQQSSYLELAPNLNFMNSLTQPPLVHKLEEMSHTQDFSSTRKPKNGGPIAKCTISSPEFEKNPFTLGFDGPPLTSFGRRKVPLPHASLPGPLPIPVPSNLSKSSDYISNDPISDHF